MRSFKLISIALAAALSGACSSSASPIITGVAHSATVDLQVLHASPDAPAVLDNVDFKVGSGHLVVEAGTQNVEVAGLLADGTSISAFGPTTLRFAGGNVQTVVARDAAG